MRLLLCTPDLTHVEAAHGVFEHGVHDGVLEWSQEMTDGMFEKRNMCIVEVENEYTDDTAEGSPQRKLL